MMFPMTMPRIFPFCFRKAVTLLIYIKSTRRLESQPWQKAHAGEAFCVCTRLQQKSYVVHCHPWWATCGPATGTSDVPGQSVGIQIERNLGSGGQDVFGDGIAVHFSEQRVLHHHRAPQSRPPTPIVLQTTRPYGPTIPPTISCCCIATVLSENHSWSSKVPAQTQFTQHDG